MAVLAHLLGAHLAPHHPVDPEGVAVLMGISTATIPSMMKGVLAGGAIPQGQTARRIQRRGQYEGNRAMAMVSIMVAQAPPLARMASRARPKLLASVLTMGSKRPRTGTLQSQGCDRKLVNQPAGASPTCFISGVRAPLRSPISLIW